MTKARCIVEAADATDWFSPRVARTEALAGLLVALALIPPLGFFGVARLVRFVPAAS